MKGFIYKITNKVNDKVYIGQTRYTVESRWRQHLKNFNIEHRQQPLYCAFAKHGIENFNIEVVEEVPIEKLDEREIYWIAYYDSFKNGYNATLGGHGTCVYYWTDNQYEEIRTLYLSGFTVKKIANLYNVSSYTISNILKGLSVKLRCNPLNMNAQEKNEFIERYKTGTSLTTLAKEYNTDREAVKRFLIKNNVDIRIHSLILKDELLQKEFINDFLDGMTFVDLEHKYKSDARTLQKILTLHGIDLNIKRGVRNTRKNAFCLTDKECLEVIKLYNSKTPVKDIAKKFEINITTLYSLLERYGVEHRRYNHSKSVQPLKENI